MGPLWVGVSVRNYVDRVTMSKTRQYDESRYLDYIDAKRIPAGDSIIVERHCPKPFNAPYHHHPSIELNYLVDCDMEYSFSGTKVKTMRDRLTVFWGAMPHCVTQVFGKGETLNVYIDFSHLLSWNLPNKFVDSLICGEVFCASEPDPVDALLIPRWALDFRRSEQGYRTLLAGEVEMRLRRLATGPWTTLMSGQKDVRSVAGAGGKMRYAEEMLRFVAYNYTLPITVTDVAHHVGLSQSYGMTIFRKIMGIPIKEHITRIRLSHAQMLLSGSDMKIVSIAMDSGFGSLSAFYEAFQARTGQSPAAFRRNSRQ
jgi:AraC family transcriptional regulator, melibiose operon regulatory protein